MSALVRITRVSTIPGLALPIIAQIVAGATVPTSGYWAGVGLIAGVYLWILLGSMCLNACLILRHGPIGSIGRKDRSIAVAVPALTGIVIAGMVLLGVRAYGIPLLVLAGVTALLSIVITANALERSYSDPVRFSRLIAGAPAFVRVAYLVAVAAAIVAAVASDLAGSYTSAPSFIENPATWILLLLGLPWSFWVQTASFLVLFVPFINGGSTVSASHGVTVMTIALMVPAVFNAIVVARTFRPASRTPVPPLAAGA